MRLTIGDTKWKIRLLSPEKFQSIHGSDSADTAAVTDPGANTIDFRTDDLSLEHVRHELFHAYFTLTLVRDSNMKKDDVEELSASLMGKYAEDLVQNSKKIWSWIKKREKL